MKRSFPAALAIFALAACSQTDQPASAVPGNSDDHAPWAGIAADETVRFTGTEPFWGGESSGRTLTYSTPEDQQGKTIAVERFAGRNGLSLSGELDSQPFVMAITEAACSDGMSDRSYPFTVTLQVRGEQRRGCAWTERSSFSGPQQP